MTDKDYTHIGLVIDRTGSMGTITKSGTRGGDATAGIRELLKEQAALPGKLTVSITEFDNPGTKPEVKNVVWFVPADHMAVASWPGIMPRGNTPLLDAVGITITDTGARLAVMSEDERPGKVLLVIATDGEENDSRDWTRQQVRDLIEQQQRDYGWRFMYIGASPEAFAEARKMGMPAMASVGTAGGQMHTAYAASSGNISNWRTTDKDSALNYTPTQRVKLAKDDDDDQTAQ